MPDKVRLVRNDGTILEATPEQASRLALLGYKEETPEAEVASAAAESRSDFYTSGGQKVITGLEGIGSGATFGGTDYLFGDNETKLRAQYNPGVRMATEALGAFAPMLLTDGAAVGAETTTGSVARAAKWAPTNLLADAAKALAPGAEGSLTKSVLTGAIEGGAYGGAGAADHTYLDGDPVTAEAVLHGIGWGAIIGGGLSGIGHGIEAVGKGEADDLLVEQGKFANARKYEADKAERLTAADKTRYETQLASAKAGVREEIPVGALRNSAGAEFDSLNGEVSELVKRVKVSTKTADASVENTLNKIIEDGQTAPMAEFGGEVEFAKEVDKARTLYKKVTQATNAGKFDAAAAAAEEYTSHVTSVASKLKMDMPNPGKALDQLISARRVGAELGRFPRSVEEFATMSQSKLETTLASLEKVKTLPYDNVGAIQSSAEEFSKAMGIEGQDLRSTWRAAKQLHSSEGTTAKEIVMPRPPRIYEPKEPKMPKAEPEHEGAGMGRKILGYAAGGKAYAAARAAGVGHTTAYGAYLGVKQAVTNGGRDLAVARASALGKVKQAAASYLPGVGQAVKTAAPRVEPLATTLFGQEDKITKDKKQLALNRLKEINDFAPTAKDSIYRALEPLGAIQPQLAPAMHASALTAFQALQELMPKDPGVLSNMKSIWKPSELYASIMGKQLSVFHDPVGEATLMLQSGNFDPIKIEALKEIAPNTWLNLRVELLQRITQPGVLDKTSYRDQIGLSTMLDLPIHSSMAPEYIATSQQMFLDRAAPLKAMPRQSATGGMPDVSNNPNMTSTQRNNAH